VGFPSVNPLHHSRAELQYTDIEEVKKADLKEGEAYLFSSSRQNLHNFLKGQEVQSGVLWQKVFP